MAMFDCFSFLTKNNCKPFCLHYYFSHFVFIYIATFLKKSGAKNFHTERFLAHIVRSAFVLWCAIGFVLLPFFKKR